MNKRRRIQSDENPDDPIDVLDEGLEEGKVQEPVKISSSKGNKKK